jgi:hypothetical protein
MAPTGIIPQAHQRLLDDTVPLQFSRDYVEQKKNKGESVQLLEIPRAGHFDLIDPRFGGLQASYDYGADRGGNYNECIADSRNMSKQNVTISLTRQTIERLRVLAARRSTSLSVFLAEQVDVLVREDESAYKRAQRQAMMLLDQGFHLGGVIRASRDESYKR